MSKIEWSAQVDPLLYRIKQQDKPALRALYDMASGKLLGIIVRVVQDRSEAEDVLQEVFVKIWQQAGKYTGAGSAWGWLCVLARNAALDRLRGLNAHPHISTDDDDSLLQSLFQEHNFTDNHSIKHCLTQLKEQSRQAILLSFIHGYSHGELVTQMSNPG